MSYKDRPFSERFGRLGDEAEGIFEATYPEGFAAYGLRRPPVNLSTVPPFVRYTPDYLTSKGLVEVQGFGNDQVFKLKVDKYEALVDWNVLSDFRVDLFVWDSSNHQYGWVRLADLALTIASDRFEMREFPEGKPYYAIKAEDLPVIEWVPYEPAGT